jgi:sec-independent protein translocase protein TatB
MFDVSFSELVVIAVVALIVIGPEKLPKVARTLGALAGRMQRYVAQVKEEVNREVRFEELQKLQQEIQSNVTKVKDTIESSFQEGVEAVSSVSPEFKLEPVGSATSDEISVKKKPKARKPRAKKTSIEE